MGADIHERCYNADILGAPTSRTSSIYGKLQLWRRTFGDDPTPGKTSAQRKMPAARLTDLKTHPIYPYVSSTTYLEWHYAFDTMEI